MVQFANYLDPGDGLHVTLITGGSYGTLTVRPGYDDVTGLGSPLVPRLARRLADVSR